MIIYPDQCISWVVHWGYHSANFFDLGLNMVPIWVVFVAGDE